MIKTDLELAIKQAEKAEKLGSFFSAAIMYKDALKMASKIGNSNLIKQCKRKVVEMNMMSIRSGKDFKEYEFTHVLSEKQQEKLQQFIRSFLSIKDKNVILKIIGLHPEFMPTVKDVETLAKKSMPVTYQIATLTSITESGHVLRGGSDAYYHWFMQMYDITQKQIMSLCLNRLIYMLIHSNPFGTKMTITELYDYFSKSGLIDRNKLKIVRVGLQHYFEEDYISALHILVPQFEALILDIVQKCGINIVALDNKDIATRKMTLSENNFNSQDFINIFGEDFCRQIKFILFEPMGYKMRHKIAHGEINSKECNFQNTTLILYLYLVLLARMQHK